MPNMALGKVPLCMTHIRLKWAVNEDGAHKMTIGIGMANGSSTFTLFRHTSKDNELGEKS